MRQLKYIDVISSKNIISSKKFGLVGWGNGEQSQRRGDRQTSRKTERQTDQLRRTAIGKLDFLVSLCPLSERAREGQCISVDTMAPARSLLC